MRNEWVVARSELEALVTTPRHATRQSAERELSNSIALGQLKIFRLIIVVAAAED